MDFMLWVACAASLVQLALFLQAQGNARYWREQYIAVSSQRDRAIDGWRYAVETLEMAGNLSPAPRPPRES